MPEKVLHIVPDFSVLREPVAFRALICADRSFLAPQAACLMALWEVMVCWRRMAASRCCLCLSGRKGKQFQNELN